MSEDYFNKIVPLRLQTVDREERRCLVRVKVCQSGSSTASHGKDLTIQLTDDEEPYFFYYVAISDDDFQRLKTQQGLRVDFSSFPHNIVNLLEQCVRESSSDDPKFLLHLACSSAAAAQLEMIETNPFKHLTHLSLKVVAGSDAALKKHLAQCVRLLKEEKALMQDRFSTCQADLSRAQQLLEERTRQLASVRAESSTEVSQLVSAHGVEIARLKEDSRQALASAEDKLEKQRLVAQEGHGETVRRLEKQAEVLSESLQRIMAEKSAAQESLQQTRMELARYQESQQSALSSLEEQRSSKVRLEKESQELSAKVSFQSERIAQLEQHLQEKEKAVKRTTQLLEKAAEQKESAVNALAGQQTLSVHLEEKVQALTAEVAKGNEIIKRMHQELRACKAKIKNRNLLAVEQEKLLAGKETNLEQHQRELETLTTALRDNEQQLAAITREKTALDNEMARLQDELQKSQNVINYLNRQVTEQRLGHHQHQPPSALGQQPAAEGSGLSTVNHPYVASSWPAASGSNEHAPGSAGAILYTDMASLKTNTGPSRPPLQPIQALQPGTTSGYALAEKEKNFAGAPKRSGIPVATAAANAQKKAGDSAGPGLRSLGTHRTAAVGGGGGEDGTPASAAALAGSSQVPGGPLLSSQSGLDPRYLHSVPAGALSNFAPNAPAGIKHTTALDSAYFPR